MLEAARKGGCEVGWRGRRWVGCDEGGGERIERVDVGNVFALSYGRVDKGEDDLVRKKSIVVVVQQRTKMVRKALGQERLRFH